MFASPIQGVVSFGIWVIALLVVMIMSYTKTEDIPRPEVAKAAAAIVLALLGFMLGSVAQGLQQNLAMFTSWIGAGMFGGAIGFAFDEIRELVI